MGAIETLRSLNLAEVEPDEYLSREFNAPVVSRIDPWHYVQRTDGSGFDLQHFFNTPYKYRSIFKPYTRVTDLFIACHYWDPRSPVFMKPTDMREPGFRIRVIADVSCDIPGPIPSTIRASSIAEPFYGYDPLTEQEVPPFDLRGVTVMAVDNLPAEIPRDASMDFGRMLIDRVMPSLAGQDRDGIIERATIVRKVKLTEQFEYLRDYLGT